MKRAPSISDLKPAPYNPRHIDDKSLAALSSSMGEFGDISGIVWNQRTGHVVSGHQRLRTLKEKHPGLKMAHGEIQANGHVFPVRIVDWPLAKEKAANIAANSPLLSGGFTDGIEALVRDVSADLPELANDLRLDALLDSLGDAGRLDGEIIEDEIPEPPKTAITKPGDIWTLGDHRVLCGDSTDGAATTMFLDGQIVNLTLTDPPYGIGDTTSGKNDYATYEDTRENLAIIVETAFPIALEVSGAVVLTPGNMNQCLYPPPTWTMAWFVPAGTGRGPWGFICWQPILCYGTDPKLKAGLGSHPDAIVHTEPASSDQHPCAKPINFWGWLMERTSERDHFIFDPFLGSGTTLVAAEQLNRRCFGIEISPAYCDVVVERWENLTGGKAKREAN
jgi:hypothetical protein